MIKKIINKIKPYVCEHYCSNCNCEFNEENKDRWDKGYNVTCHVCNCYNDNTNIF